VSLIYLNKSRKIYLFINLTPFIPLSFKGEGEEILKRGALPLFDSPYSEK